MHFLHVICTHLLFLRFIFGAESDFPPQNQISPIVNKCCPLNEEWVESKCAPKKITQFNNVDPTEKNLNSSNNYNEDSGPTSNIFRFKIDVGLPNCPLRRRIERVVRKKNFDEQEMREGEKFWADQEEEDKTPLLLSTEGTLLWRDSNELMHSNTHSEFCIDQTNETSYVALICEPICNDSFPCVRKCCSRDYVIDPLTNDCINVDELWNPLISSIAKSGSGGFLTSSSNTNFIYGDPICKDIFKFEPKAPKDMLFLSNGSLVATFINGDINMYDPSSYCVDGSYNRETNSTDGAVALICFYELLSVSPEPWRVKLYAYLMLTSSFFLLLTAIKYLILWDFQNIHGWLQFVYVGSVFFAFSLLAIVQLFTEEIGSYSDGLCESLGTLTHFSFLSAFFWLTSMNFDLWYTFSGCQPLRPSSKTGEKKRFVIFGIFAWGIPGLIAGTGFILDHIYKNQISPVIRPRFGERKCYFFGEKEQLPYFYIPVGILLFVDLLFFLSTVYSLQKIQQDTKFATSQCSKQDKKRFVIFMKIFIVMGVLWIFEVISWAFEVYSPNDKNSQDIFTFFDIINALQGLWVFIIFTCKPNTCRQLETKFKKLALSLESIKESGGEKGYGTWFKKIPINLLLPLVHFFRRTFGLCGKRKNSLVSRRVTSHNTTLTSNFEKSRKFSDSSSGGSTQTESVTPIPELKISPQNKISKFI